MPDPKQEELMVVTAWMHYVDDLTHEQIAKRLNLSRVKVTRLLHRARSEGVVQFKITRSLPQQYELERQLQAAFGLAGVRVARSGIAPDEVLDEMGQWGAALLRHRLFPDCRLGVGWSTTVSRIAKYFEAPQPPIRCTVNELVGGYPGHVNPYSISVRIADALQAPLEALPAPAFVQSAEAYAVLVSENPIRSALERARRCDVAVVGLGDLCPTSTIVQSGFMTVEEIDEVRRQGAVGDVLGRLYDIHGQLVATRYEERTIGISLDDFRRIPHVIAMAAGPTKVEAIWGAIQGKFVHTLVTDTETAQQLLQRQVEQGGDNRRPLA